ncbi:hypothetical protein [Methylobacterium soli]|uniref:Uncharacterized protein n=1 Tax=Methylobacterium soli TaxID=553447 RepID=A0A6L3SWU3_9HYPH|nr:hypothetical protein [Methylobacterium soli]KAB1072380.1 hypothetical protein F6X53_28255 [Methylobacterium soli]GJE41417.1 hypothetical protein AEGHOMDF_0583 [Methylobacterium soli]
MTEAHSAAHVQADQADQAGSTATSAPRQRSVQDSKAPTASADELLEQAAEALTRKAIQMALAGNAPALRHCLNRLASLHNERPISFTLPAINGPEDLPTATLALLQAVAAGEITPAEAAALARLVETHIQAVEAADFNERLRRLEEAQDLSAASSS